MKDPINNCRFAKYPVGDITQWFGENPELYQKYGSTVSHNGIDIVRPWGEHLFAVEDGVIASTKEDPSGYGKNVRLLGKPNREGVMHDWAYGHLSYIHVKPGQEVKAGQYIGNIGNCFDKETEILTEDGWKLFAELDKTEKVATLNRDTDEIEYHKPTHYTERMEEKIYKFANYHSVDFAVTGDHPMWVELQDGKMHTVAMSDLPKYSWLKQSGGKWVGREVEAYTVGDKSVPMDTWLDFLGWFWSDGCTQKNTVRITQSFNNDKKRETIESVLNKMPYDIKQYGEDYAIHSKELAEEVRRVKASDSLPTYLFSLSARQIRIFLDAYWGGDGWMHKSTKYYIVPNEKVAGQIQELIMKCGGYATVKMRDPATTNRKKPAMIGDQEVVSTKPCWVITEGQHRMAMIRKDRVEEVEYNDKVYCVTVENHIIYVRRNGRPMWCHNTGFVVSGNTPFWKDNPYAGTHLHFGVRDVVHDGKGWKYEGYDRGLRVLNYGNGWKGRYNPLPLFRNPELLSSKIISLASVKQSKKLFQFGQVLRSIGK